MTLVAIVGFILVGLLSLGVIIGLAKVLSGFVPQPFDKLVLFTGVVAGLAGLVFANFHVYKYLDKLHVENYILESEPIQVLKEYFPSEYAEFLQIAQDRKSRAEQSRLAAAAGEDLFRNHAENLRAAPPERIRAIFNTVRELLPLVAEDYNWRVCNQFLNEGPRAISGLNREYDFRLEKQSRAVLIELGKAEGKPALRGPPTAADSLALKALWDSGDREQSDEEWNLLLNPDFERPETCQAHILLYDYMYVLDDDVADRLMAELLISTITPDPPDQ